MTKVNLTISNVDKNLMNYDLDKVLLEPDVRITDTSGSYEGADE